MEKLRIIVGGFIGLYPTGGVTWDYVQWVLGLKQLGHDVYYVEDTAQYPKYQKEGKSWNDASDSVDYLKQTMEHFGFAEKWAYRDVASGHTFGLTENRLKELCRTADVFINVSASTCLRAEYLNIPKRVFIDSDPMFTQIDYYQQAQSNTENNPYRMNVLLDNHNYLFTFGENIGADDCKIPLLGLNWRKTRQPICLRQWGSTKLLKRRNAFTTVMNWSVNSNLIYDETSWGQKNVEFERFMQLPELFPETEFEIMVSNIPGEKEADIKSAGWHILNPLMLATNATDYRNYISSSAAEFSVAKETYVKSASGWFSCRSACYLAAGVPAIAQETGWSKYIPSGEGLFAFADMESAADAIKEVKGNLSFHSRRAQEIAHAYFDSDKVLTDLLEQLN